jgi:hypothetical protein
MYQSLDTFFSYLTRLNDSLLLIFNDCNGFVNVLCGLVKEYLNPDRVDRLDTFD